MSERQNLTLSYLKQIRYGEVLLLSGPPFLAVWLALNSWSDFAGGRFVLFGLAVFLLIAHVYTFNDWSAFKSETPRDIPEINPDRLLPFSLGLLLPSLWLFWRLSLTTLALGLSLGALSLLYSHPRTKLKSVPVASSLVHLAGGVLLFLLGYSLFSGLTLRGVLIAFYFATLFCAGHLVQEIVDFSADQASRLNTNPIRFGKAKTFQASFLLFTLAPLYLLVLVMTGRLAVSLIYAQAAVYAVYLYLFSAAWRKKLVLESLVFFRAGYRLLYIGLGIYIWLVSIWQIPK